MKSHMTLQPAISPTVYRLLPNDPFLREVKRIHSDIAKRAYELSAANGFPVGTSSKIGSRRKRSCWLRFP